MYRGSAVGGTNIQGEEQKKLDVLANDLFINMLKSSFEVTWIGPRAYIITIITIYVKIKLIYLDRIGL